MKRGWNKQHTLALTLNIFSILIFVKVLQDIYTNGFTVKWDELINLKLSLLWNNLLLNKIMIFVTNIVSPAVLVILSLFLFPYLIYKKRQYKSLLLVLSLAIGVLSELTIKSLTSRARPELSLVDISIYSFPSGHATIAIIFFSFLIYSLKDDIKNKTLKLIFILVNVALFILVAFSRVYLGAHWFSDVIAGLALGLFIITSLMFIFKFLGFKDTKN